MRRRRCDSGRHSIGRRGGEGGGSTLGDGVAVGVEGGVGRGRRSAVKTHRLDRQRLIGRILEDRILAICRRNGFGGDGGRVRGVGRKLGLQLTHRRSVRDGRLAGRRRRRSAGGQTIERLGGEGDGVDAPARRAGVEAGDEVEGRDAAVQDVQAIERSGVHRIGELLTEFGERRVDVADLGVRLGRLGERGVD